MPRQRISFRDALSDRALIAEFKRASPFTGPIAPDANVDDFCRWAKRRGAKALSILVDERWGGSYDDLLVASRATDLPIMAKGMNVDEELARLHGADAMLCFDWGLTGSLEKVVEVEGPHSLERALDEWASTILVNNRDLFTGNVDLMRSFAATHYLAEEGDVKLIAASGYSDPGEAWPRADGVLIGTALMKEYLND